MGVDIQTYRAKIGTYRHSYGVDVVTQVIVINFSNGLKSVGCVLFIGILLIMAGVEQNPGPRNYDNAQVNEPLETTKIKVTDVSENISKEVIELFFREQGWGDIKEVTADSTNRSVIIEFVDAKAVDALLQQLPICILGTTVTVERLDERCDPDESNMEQDALQSDEAGVGNIRSTKIRVTGLPKGATNEVLIMVFENEKRQGGGKVKDVLLVDEGNSAIVDFEDASAVDKVMQNKPINILGHKVTVDVFDGSTSNTRPTKIEVTGLPKGITDEVLTMFFENEHRQGGGPVKCVKIDNHKHVGVVEFEEPEAVETVMQKQPIVMFDTQVKIHIIRHEKQQLETEEELKTIKVSGLPGTVTDEILLMFFENEKRQGGGKVTEIRLNKTEGSAFVEFEEEKAVRIVLEKQPIRILGHQVKVEKYIPIWKPARMENTKIFVTGLPDTITDEVLIMFFENEKRQGGGKVVDVTMDKVKRCAIIEFETHTAVIKVLQNRPISIFGSEVKVDLYDPAKSNKKLVVSGLPGNISTEFLAMFFEHEKGYGGGPVKQVEMSEDKQKAVIEFEEAKSVDIVIKKQPISIQDTAVQISLFDPDYEDEAFESTAIKVSGLPGHMSVECLEMFFENEKRQGGGKVKSVEINEKRRYAIIEFENKKAVETVLQKRPILIEKNEVTVEVYTKYPMKDSATGTEIRKLLVSDLPGNVTEEYLTMFFENEERQGGGQVNHVVLNMDDLSAIIEFEKHRALTTVLEKRPITMSGKKINVEIFDPTKVFTTGTEIRKLIVSDLPRSVTEEYLTVFFESEKRQGGGKVNRVELNMDDLSAIIEFEDTRALTTVLEKRPITMSGKLITVEIFGQCTAISGQQEHFTRDYIDETREKLYSTENGSRFDSQQSNTKKPPVPAIEQQLSVNTAKPSHDQMRTGATDLTVQEDSHDCKTGKLNDLQQQEYNDLQKEPKESEGIHFGQMLQRLGLKNKYPGKISIQDVIAVDPSEASNQYKSCISYADIPWMMLKRLICAHSESRDMTASDDKNVENNIELDNLMSYISNVSEENQDLSPLDIFTVVFQCCDPLMKQIFFQKLYLCKIAVPFLYKCWKTRESQQHILSVWPLRSLAIENKCLSGSSHLKSREVDLLEFETKVIAFARFGRPRYSKSKLINSLLSTQGCKTFFNIDCPSGMTPRHLSNGTIEMFWLPTVGDNKDRFQDAMTFMNMRGDLNEHFNVTILTFIADFADAVTIFIDLESIIKRANEVRAILLNFSSVILVIADPLRSDVVKLVQNFQAEVIALKQDINLRVLSTHKGVIEQNVVDIVSSMSKYITSQLKSNSTRSFQERLKYSSTDTVITDEQEKHCEHGRKEAEALVQQMKTDGESRRWKQVLTPVHSAYSQQLGKLMKKREREKNFKGSNALDSEIKKVRQQQTQSITKTVEMFIDILIRNEKTHLNLKFFLSWLHFYIEREKRKVLPNLMYENRCAWETLKQLKSKETKVQSEIEHQETVITELEVKIDEASFSIEHFFREVGHIYEAMLELNVNLSKFKLPPLERIAKVIGNLVADGHQLELIDGESFYMPYLWTDTILKQVDRTIDSSKVMTLSVLGLQSSGKSTLLNTMFGSQFSTRTGRCTRGIHVQLIPAKTLRFEDTVSPFNYVLVADTEGLRSPELSHVQHEHDNELATVITGIGDVTMLNIMGENTSEIRDILQVIVHAFLRLKMTNRNLDIRKSCAFIHQNVTDTSASQNMISGLSKLMQTLDEMTKEAARSEGILEISTFNQVIEFDITSQVWYLKNLWQGNPPMARVNSEYSEKVVDMKCKILQKALQMKNKSYKSLSDIVKHAYSLWKGVLNEDFVFSFRNSLEIRAYMEMERVVQDELWRLESFIRDKLVDITQNKFASCEKKDNLRHVANTLINELNVVLADEKAETEAIIKTHFEKNKYKDIIIQWKNSQHGRIDSLCLKLEKIIREEIEKSHGKRSVEILTVANHEEHEEELSRKSMEVANRYKGKKLNRKQIDNLFDDIWQSFITKIDAASSSVEQSRVDMHSMFKACLINIFKKDHALLKEALTKSSDLQPLSNLTKLEGSFKDTGIEEKDISFTTLQNVKVFFKVTNAMKQVCKRVNQIFEAIDEKINRLCQVEDEITEMNVNKLMFELNKSIDDMLKGNTEYDFKRPFYVKLYVHVCRHAHPVFEKHNENYFQTQGIAARLEQYKAQQKISFEAHLSNRQSEDHAAMLFSNVIEIFAEEWVSQSISNKVTDELHSALPGVKNRVIIEICTELLEKDIFEKFIRYLQAPKEYASVWITEKSNNHLFDDKTHAYASVATSLLRTVFTNVKESVRTLQNYYERESAPTIEKWIHNFQESLKKSNISIEPERFREVKKVKQIRNIEYLTKEILAELEASEEILKTRFSQHTFDSVRWKNTNPVDRIIKKIWGCSERCYFCGEPCAKNKDHEGSVHYSIQHRPSCCKGTRKSNTKKAALESCDFKIQSDQSHECGVFNYVCNSGTRESCGKNHYYRDFKKYLPDWDITPTSNMHDTSKFWMWFVSTYRAELHDYYDYIVDDIPSSWKAISKEEAKQSLQKTYCA